MPNCLLQAHVAIYIKINLVPDDRGVKRLKVGLSRCSHAWDCLLTKICHEPNPNPRPTSPIVPSSPSYLYAVFFSATLGKRKGKRFVQMKCNKKHSVACCMYLEFSLQLLLLGTSADQQLVVVIYNYNQHNHHHY